MRRLPLLAATALAIPSLAFGQVAQTGYVTGPAGQTLSLLPTTNFVQSCNGGAGGIVGQSGCTFPTTTTATISGAITLGAGSAIVGKVGIDQTTPGTTNGIVNNPTSVSTSAITPVVSTSAESNHVLKGSAGNLYSVIITAGSTAGYLMVFNATSAPGDGAVAPAECVAVPANASVSLNFAMIPEAYSTGITAVFSSTGCFTKTASATAFFKGNVQ